MVDQNPRNTQSLNRQSPTKHQNFNLDQLCDEFEEDEESILPINLQHFQPIQTSNSSGSQLVEIKIQQSPNVSTGNLQIPQQHQSPNVSLGLIQFQRQSQNVSLQGLETSISVQPSDQGLLKRRQSTGQQQFLMSQISQSSQQPIQRLHSQRFQSQFEESKEIPTTKLTIKQDEKTRISILESRVDSLEKRNQYQQSQIQQMNLQIAQLMQYMKNSNVHDIILEEKSKQDLGSQSFSSQSQFQKKTSNFGAESYGVGSVSRIKSELDLTKKTSKHSSLSLRNSSLSKGSSFKDQSSNSSPAPPKLKYQHSTMIDNGEWAVDSAESEDEVSAISQPGEQTKQVDIAFLYADVLVYEKEDGIVKSMNQDQELSADIMYQQIIDTLVETKKTFNIFNRGLYPTKLKDVLTHKKPTVLFLNCHGGLYKDRVSKSQVQTYFCFEDENIPTKLSKFDEAQLAKFVQSSQVQLVVISACHSSRLGKVLVDAGVPVVVCISSSVQVLEKAAEIFNKAFLQYLLNGFSPKMAFENGLSVLSIQNDTSGICCCYHDHTAECLWIQYKEKTNSYEAHKIHAATCKCQGQKNFGPIDHQHDCAQFRNFYNKLADNNKKIEMVLDKQYEDGFLKSPAAMVGQVNKMCCCAQNLPHNESQKFIIMGDEKAQETPIFVLEKRQDGKVHEDLPIDYKNLPEWLRKTSTWLFDRNFEIHQIVEFLLSKKRLLTVIGESGIGRNAVITRAIKIVMSRHTSKFHDGVFEVNLENVGIASVVKRISDKLGLSNPFPKEESLYRDLIKKDSLIVFSDCQMTSSEQTQTYVTRLISRIIMQTAQDDRLKFILIIDQKHNQNHQSDFEQVVKIAPMSRNGKVRLFFHQMKLQNKGNLIKVHEQKIRDHGIFDAIGPWYMNKIVNEYKNLESLDNIQKEIELQLVKQKSTPSGEGEKYLTDQHLRLRSLCVSDLLKKIPIQNQYEKNLIYFLCLTPGGMTETELKQLTKIYKKWFGQDFLIFDHLNNIHQIEEQSYLDVLEIQQCQELSNQPVVKIAKKYQQALELILDHAELQIKGISNKKIRTDLLSICIEFMGSQARSLLRSIKKMERSGDFVYRLVSAHLDRGMWWRHPTEEEFFDEEIEYAEQRFSQFYLANFKYLLDNNLLNQHFKDLWSGKTSYESEYIFELCITVPSILVQLSRYQEAEEIIKQCRKFGGETQLFLHGYLDLMLASIYVYFNTKVSSKQIKDLLISARNTFKQFNDAKVYNSDDMEDVGYIEGRAETYFVEALMNIQLFKNEMQNPQQLFRHYDSTPMNVELKLENHHNHKTHSLNPVEITTIAHDYSNQARLVKEISESLDKAFRCFELLDDGFDVILTNKSNKQFGKAKTILVEADFFINFHKAIPFKELMNLGFNKFNKEEQLKNLQRAETLFQERGEVIETKKHTSYEAGLQKNKNSQKSLEALAICLQAQLKMLHEDGQQSQDNKDDIIDARTIIDRAIRLVHEVDDNMVQTINSIKNKILNEMRIYSHNLFTFAKAWPLVEIENNKVKSIGEFPTSKFELAPNIIDEFYKSGLDLQIKFDFLNEDCLKAVLDGGSRVLHLSSDLFDRDCLYLEDELGKCLKIKLQDMQRYFGQFKLGAQFKGSDKLPVDCVVLAMPDSVQIGQIFSQMGVPHVIAFELQPKPESQIESQLMPIRYNYIYAFCQEFYIKLVKQVSVRQAFLLALEKVNLKMTLDMDIWQMRDCQQCDLGVKPKMMDFDNKRHDKKLFDTTCLEKEKEFLRKGQLYDCSKARGHLIEIKKSKFPFIGHKIEMHHVMTALTDQKSVKHLCHIKGKRGTGKTRFMKEVAYYLYQRGKFSFKIQYQDLTNIKTEQAFKDMLQEKNLYDEQCVQEVWKKNSVQIFLVFDNIDHLPKEIAKRFETRLIDLIQANSGLRFLTSSTKTFAFEHFQKVELNSLNQNQDQPKMVFMHLKPLNPLQSIDLLLSMCPRQITRQELDMDEKNTRTIHQQLQLEAKITCLENKPNNIVDFAKKLEHHPFYEIKVRVQHDDMKHLQNHHNAKPKSGKVQFSIDYQNNRKEQNENKQRSATKDRSPQTRKKFKTLETNSELFEFNQSNQLTNPLLLSTNIFQQSDRSVDQSMIVLQSSQGETPEIGRSRSGSYAVGNLNFQAEHILDSFQLVRQLDMLGPPILKSGVSVFSTHEMIQGLAAENNQNREYTDNDSDFFEEQKHEQRSRGPSDVNQFGEQFQTEFDRKKSSGNKNQKLEKVQKKKPIKVRAINKYKKNRKTPFLAKRVKQENESSSEEEENSNDNIKSSQASSSPSDVTAEISTVKQPKKKKLSKQMREELEWEQKQKKHI